MQTRSRPILCPIDFSDGTDELLDWAIELAEERAGHVVLLHAYRLPFELQQIEGAFIPDPFWRELREQTERELHARAERVRRAGIPVTEIAREGPPAQVTLDEAARLQPELIVIGAAQRHLFGAWLHGRVTRTVVSQAPCPVLTVRTH